MLSTARMQHNHLGHTKHTTAECALYEYIEMIKRNTEEKTTLNICVPIDIYLYTKLHTYSMNPILINIAEIKHTLQLLLVDSTTNT